MNFLEAIVAFRKSVFFRIFYVSIISLMVAALTLYAFALGCLSILLSSVVMFAIPYWLKERKTRTFALNGLLIFILATLIFGALFAQTLSGNDPIPVTASGFNASLTNATVTPGRGAPDASYTFTATLTVPGAANVSRYHVWVNLTTVDGVETPLQLNPVEVNDSNLTNGKAYFANIPVDDHIYFFWFSVAVDTGTSTSWFTTRGQIGPITAGYGTFLGFSLFYGAISMILPISFFFIILMLYWWTQRARAERKRLGMAVETESTDSGFMCTNCGADVPADATNCPKCGAVFEEPPAASPAAEPAEAGEGADEKP